LQEQHPFATAIGEAMPSMAVPAGGGLKAMMLAGGIPGALEYGDAEERATKGIAGAIGGGLGYGVSKGLQALAQPFDKVKSATRDTLVKLFEDKNIPVSTAQRSGNKSLKWLDATLDDLTFSSGPQQEAKQAQRAAFNREVSKTYGDNTAELTHEARNAAKQRIGASFEDLSNRNRLNFTNQTLNDVAKHQFDAERFAATRDDKALINNLWDDILSKVEPDGTISGRAYKEFDSKVGKKIKGVSSGDLRSYLGVMRDILRNAMDDSISSADQEAWKTARKQYANLQIVSDVAKNDPLGNVSAAGLLQRVNQQSPIAKFHGGGELGDLARAGKELLSPMSNSGTAPRSYWTKALTGESLLGMGVAGGLIDPVTALTVGAGGALLPIGLQKGAQSAMWGGPLSKYLENGLINLSPGTKNALNRLGQGAGVAASRRLIDQ
jgi:hypothetical protein